MSDSQRMLNSRNLRFIPAREEQEAVVEIGCRIENESFSGALLHLSLEPGQQVVIQREGHAPFLGEIARVAPSDEGSVLIGIRWRDLPADPH